MLKTNIKDSVLDFQYLISILIILAIPLSSIIGVLNSKANEGQVAYLYLLINIFIFIILLGITVTLTTINEKTSGRCEFYLANNVGLKELISTYTSSTFILSILPIILLNVILLGFMYLTKNTYIKVIYNRLTIQYLFALIIFCYMFSNLIIYLVMLIKNPSKLRTILTITGMVSVNALAMPMKYLLNNNILPTPEVMMNMYTLVLFVFNLITIISIIIIKKKVSIENVILSYKE